MKKLLFVLAVFISMTVNAQQDTCACCTENHQAFDFWVGTWNVTNTDGTPAGKNIITKIEDECVLRENWTSAKGGYTGTSYNFYNAQKKQWEQIWIDNKGGSLHLKGNRVGNEMILQSDEVTSPKGQKYVNRVTWTLNENGSVRQHWETSGDQKTWATVFDGLYVKEK
ncbi:hypothetical protein H2O64_18105 [Kordia sp. YSTF-M3]|uniref:DUF1579 domain-containing protein n=1 Tax=Kordia aestuariivivens TaxID=2759037 RepID=A0ABR7QDZ3_9FLAO|nr:hypothetical protein [Kordia aestuariivivens]MBC8756591.1 hypothetical protein [Kordia aestuariivivens]